MVKYVFILLVLVLERTDFQSWSGLLVLITT